MSRKVELYEDAHTAKTGVLDNVTNSRAGVTLID
jgi:hypothetical protein